MLAKLRDAEVLAADGLSAAEIARRLEVSEQTHDRRRIQHGGMKGSEMKRLKELERENAALLRPVAKQALDNQVLKDIAEGAFEPGEQTKGDPARHEDALHERARGLPARRAGAIDAAT